jgi:hypothetical protein
LFVIFCLESAADKGDEVEDAVAMNHGVFSGGNCGRRNCRTKTCGFGRIGTVAKGGFPLLI